MGSWNGTCGISHLPICYKDPVKVLIIKNGHWEGFHQRGGGFCGSDNFFQLVGLPLDGKYEDSGLPDEYEDNVASRWMEEHLRSLFAGKKWGSKVVIDPRELKENIPDITTKPETVPLKDLIRTIERGGVWSPHRPTDRSEGWNEPYGVFLIHLGMWDQILKKHHNPKKESWYKKYKADFEKIRAFIESYERSAPDPADPTKLLTETFRMSSVYDSLFHQIGLHLVDLLELLPKKDIQKKHRDDVLWALDRMSEAATVINYMTSVRLGLMPQFGAGSQTDNYEGHIELATWTQDLAKKLKRKRRYE